MTAQPLHDYDTIVLGAGLAGASIAHAKTQKGYSVLVVDARAPHHTEGSSHGESRITRPRGGNEEHRSFNKLTADATTEIVNRLERVPGEIIRECPGLVIVRRKAEAYHVVNNSMMAARLFPFTHNAAELKQKYGYHVPDDTAAIEIMYGTLNPRVLLDRLYEHIKLVNGEIQFETPVISWGTDDNGAYIITKNGRITADDIVIAPGRFAAETLRSNETHPYEAEHLSKAFITQPVPVIFFEWPPEIGRSIVRILHDDGTGGMFSLPEAGPDGKMLFKIGFDGDDPERTDKVTTADIEQAADCLTPLFGHTPVYHSSQMCYYPLTNPSPRNMQISIPLVGGIPGVPHAYILAGTGANAAKFMVALGKELADMMDGATSMYMKDFSPNAYIPPRGAYRAASRLMASGGSGPE